MSTIVIGVDASDRSEDAIAFGSHIAGVTESHAIVACAFPYSDTPSRAANSTYREVLRDEALETAHAMRDRLVGVPDGRTAVRIMANPSPAHALHDIASAERAMLLVVGSTHTGRNGRVLPGSTGERLLHGSPCAVAIVPHGYRTHADAPIRRIGVAYNGSAEAKAAAGAAAELARAFGAELEVIGVLTAESYGTPALMGGPSVVTLRADLELHVQETLDAMVSEIPGDVRAHSVRLSGDPAEQLAVRSSQLDLLVTGSRGYGPLHSVLVGGVSGRLVRTAQCPVIVIPRGIEAPLSPLFAGATATSA